MQPPSSAPTSAHSSSRAFGPGLLLILAVLTVVGGWYTDVSRPLPDPLRPVTGLDWWITPVERNAFLRMPSVSGELYAVDVSDDGEQIWAVGADGLLIGTNDGGRTWQRGVVTAAQEAAPVEQKAARLALSPLSVAVAEQLPNDPKADPKQQYQNQARETQAPPATSNEKAPPAENADAELPRLPATTRLTLTSVAIIDRKRIVAVGFGGTILATEDGGTTWQRRTSGASDMLTGVAFADDKNGIAVGESRSVLRTEDGGVSWTLVAFPSTDASLMAVASVDRDRWTVVGDNGGYFRSTDGGRSWSIQTSVVPGTVLNDIAFAGTEGAAVGADATIAITHDGGNSWNVARQTKEGKALLSVAIRPDSWLALGWSSNGFVSRDRGQTWAPGGEAFDRNGVAVSASNRQFVAVSERGDLIRSSDGASWSPLVAYPGVFLSVAAAPDEQHLLLGGLYGTLLTSSDGGDTWQPRTPLDAHITDIEFDASGTAVVMGLPRRTSDESATFRSNDFGATWATATDADPELLMIGVRRSAAQTVTAANGARLTFEGGQLMHSDGKTDWQPAKIATAAPITKATFITDDRALAVAPGRIFTSSDGGRSFEPVAYRRYPSPWLWVASVLLIGAAAQVTRRSLRNPGVEAQSTSIADAAASDRPIEWNDPDPAGLREVALGLSRFLRNRRTEPPLTIAVTGEWGSGKSSLMNLLRHDLTRYGYRPVWFNAWHHQSGENLLGSLLANIHAQGVPSLVTANGFFFRLSLLFVRARRYWLRLTFVLFLLAVVFYAYDTLGSSAGKAWDTLMKDGVKGLSDLGAATGALGIAAAVITPFVVALRVVSAFGLQPGKLIAAVASSKADESARVEAGARYRFAREFAEFTKALDQHPLVIFIDDLDRCRAQNVIEVLEAVNFLVSSGRCIVVIGMARRWVETCVGLAFADLAKAHIEAPRPGQSATEQQLFAQQYLEKLINIEIRVPRLTDSAASLILQGTRALPPRNDARYELGTFLSRAAPLAVLALAAFAVIASGRWVAEQLNVGTVTVTAQAPAPTPASGVPRPSATKPPDEDSSATKASFEAAADAKPQVVWYFGTGTSVLLAFAALIGVALFVRKESRTDDSPAFHDALALLHPWILLGGSSPRSLKRFVNHVRYIAMRFRTVAEPLSSYERLRRRIRGWFGRPPEDESQTPAPSRVPLSEELLVALAALNRCGDTWLERLFITRDVELPALIARDLETRVASKEELVVLTRELTDSLAQFNQRFPRSPLFGNAALDRAHAIAFCQVMAFEAGQREDAAAADAPPPTALRSA